MKNIILSLMMVAVLVTAGVGGVFAGWEEDEVAGYCFGAGMMNLEIDLDGKIYDPFSDDLGSPRKIICAEGIEPGDNGKVTVSLHVTSDPSSADYYTTVAIGASSLLDDENTLVKPEETAGDTTPGSAGIGGGELDDFLVITLWWDTDNDGTGDVQIWTGTYAALVSQSQPVTLCLRSCETHYVLVEWELADYGSTQSPDSEVNKCMTDSLGGRITFHAEGPEYGPDCPAGTFCPPMDN